MARTKVVVSNDGSQLQCIHSDAAVHVLASVGKVSMRRASHVEPWAGLSPEAQATFLADHMIVDINDPKISATGWYADLSPVGGRTAGPFDTKEAALAHEVKWIEDNALGSCPTH